MARRITRTPVIIISILSAIAVILTGCGLLQNVEQSTIFQKFDAVVGMKVTIQVDVITSMTDEQIDGTTHYRYFTVTVKATPNVEIAKVAVCSRVPVIIPNGATYELYSEDVGLWEGLSWNNNGFHDVTSPMVTENQTTIYGDSVYDIPKPGRYLTVFGHDFSLGDLKEFLQGTEVPSFLRIGLSEKLGDLSGTLSDMKIPFIAELPSYNDNHQNITRHYNVQFYLPLGGTMFQAGQGATGYEFKMYETHQQFKVGYDKPHWVDVTVPLWTTWLAAGAVALVVPGIGLIPAFCYVAATAFMYDYDTDITLLRWDKNLVPFFTPMDMNPVADSVSRTDVIAVRT